ncbi:MAG: hypothetical protein EON89_13715 [Brevundimonas sp.]|nr:MAG: hypothetical protein EON89_13715 [Brevundimonas sp.]
MTIWGVMGSWLGFVAYAVAWHWGGRPERFAAAILLLHNLAAVITFEWIINGIHSPRMIVDGVRILIFVWLCFRSNRWWLFVVAAAEVLMAGMDVATLLDPSFYMASASAHVGLGYLADLIVLFSVCERVMAGEAPARHAAWARANLATTRRRNRKKAVAVRKRIPRLPA